MPQNSRTTIFIGILFIITILLGYNYFAQPFANLAQETPSATPAPETELVQEISVAGIIAQMSPEEKIAQMISVPLVIDNSMVRSTEEALQKPFRPGSELFSDPGAASRSASASARPVETEEESSPDGISAAWIEENNPGFILIFGSDINKSAATEVLETYRSLPKSNSPVSPAFAVDHEGGDVQRLNGIGYTQLPSWKEFCQLTQSDRSDYLKETASELSQTGIDLVFSPVLDTAENNFILGERICSGEYTTVASRSAEFSAAMLDSGITPVFKHFPGIGAASRDLHTSFAQVEVGDEDSQLYKDSLEEFPDAGVMITHVGVLNSSEPDVPCTLSQSCVQAFQSFFPDTLTFTDGLTMRSAGYSPGGVEKRLTDVSREAVLAGNDVLVYESGLTEESLEEILQVLQTEYESNPEFAMKVDASLIKVLEFKKQRSLIVGL